MSTPLLPVELIRKTRDGIALTDFEIQSLIQKYTSGHIPDYQMSAWLMAVVLKGLTRPETLALTQAMLHSGETLNLKEVDKPKMDKHSTGGIGDKTSLILGPLVAACGVAVPMMSGRGLGHTGGTLDKLESIPGFNTQLTIPAFIELLQKHGIGFIGQTREICPADKKIYALRDVTGTVESLDLISASIMSKKLAEDLDGLVLDVKFGTGAFMKTYESARALALSLQTIGLDAGKKVNALLTNMNQPLGAFVGNALEVKEALAILSGETLLNKNGLDLFADTRELSVLLAAHMIWLSGKTPTLSAAQEEASLCLQSGRALEVFQKVCQAQGGRLEDLPIPQHSHPVRSNQSGFIQGFDGERIGFLGIKIGAGRTNLLDKIDPEAGFQVHFKMGEAISKGDILWTIFGRSLEEIKVIEQELLNTVIISPAPVPVEDLALIRETIPFSP